MLLSLLAILGLALVVLALTLDAARRAAHRRQCHKKAELIRLRLQEQAAGQRIAYREIPIRLRGD